jgi:uncharacterized ion transporter superfamily protein YfcC
MTIRSFPHPLVLLVGCVIAATLLTYVVPAGQYDRRHDPVTDRDVVVGGTYHAVMPSPVGVLQALMSVPKGIAEAVAVVAVVLVGGAAFVVVDRTGALRIALAALIGRLGSRRILLIPLSCIAFATGGALENMQEEIIALIPVLLVVGGRLGVDNVTVVAMSVGAAAIGSAFSPINPFQVGIAQQVAQVPLFSGAAFRMTTLVLALGIWIAGTLRHATRKGARPACETDIGDSAAAEMSGIGSARAAVIIAIVLATFATFITGLIRANWGFDELTAVLFAMGLICGLVGGLGANGTAEAYVQGFREMAFAAVLIGFARAIFVVLNDGHIIDTLVNGMFTPLAQFPRQVAVLGMIAVQTVIHVPVPSVSGQAVLTMPLLVPLSDLLDISRQVTILAYQCGAGLCELITPTNGGLMAVLAVAGLRYDQWMAFALPMWLLMLAFGAAATLAAMAAGLA